MKPSDRIEKLWCDFLYQSSPGTHTYVVDGCTGCGGSSRGGRSLCATCIANELLTHGIDVCRPEWGRDENGQIKRLWAVQWVIDDLNEQTETTK